MTDVDSLASALAQVQAQLPEIAKTQTANVKTDKGSYSYSYADLAKVTKVILPLLGKCGLAWMTKPTINTDGKFVLAYKLLHISGGAEEGQYPLPTTGSPQQIGSAITYARRYTLCSVTGVAPDQDDDDAAAAEHAPGFGSRAVRRRERPADDEPPADGPTRSVGRRTRPAPGNTPPLPGEVSPDRRSGDDPIDPLGMQMKRLHASFRGLGLDDRDDALAYAAGVVGRDLTSTKELTVAEASRVIESLITDADRARPTPGDPSDQPTLDEGDPQ